VPAAEERLLRIIFPLIGCPETPAGSGIRRK
jgi:hypothetical protein